jgi:hypothetical protein
MLQIQKTSITIYISVHPSYLGLQNVKQFAQVAKLRLPNMDYHVTIINHDVQ